MFKFIDPNNDPNRKTISFTDEMIDEWAEKTGKPRELLEEMYKLHIKYVKKLQFETPDAINIRLPALGTLRLNFYLALRYRTVYSKVNKIINNKIKLLEECISNHGWLFLNFKRPLFLTQHNRINKEKTKRSLQNFYNIVKSIENKVNDDFIKKYKSYN